MMPKLWQQFQSSLCHYQVSGPWPLCMLSIIIAITVSFEKPYTRSSCSIFSLCLKSNTLEKSKNKSVPTRFFVCIQQTVII